jgi:hypothetical protein
MREGGQYSIFNNISMTTHIAKNGCQIQIEVKFLGFLFQFGNNHEPPQYFALNNSQFSSCGLRPFQLLGGRPGLAVSLPLML